MNLLHVILPELPELQFRTQHSVENVRPDMWGFDGGSPRVFIENKFWAGLTENQPVNYLQHLAEYEQPSLLLMVAPEARQDTIWHELTGRLHKAEIDAEDRGRVGNKQLFVQLVEHIRTDGYEANFYARKIVYFDEDDLTYWTMGAPVAETNWYCIECGSSTGLLLLRHDLRQYHGQLFVYRSRAARVLTQRAPKLSPLTISATQRPAQSVQAQSVRRGEDFRKSSTSSCPRGYNSCNSSPYSYLSSLVLPSRYGNHWLVGFENV